MEHDAHGWWLREAGGAEPVAPAVGDLDADVVVIGGGYAGMWTAWNLLERGARVVLLEADVCGHGPSGRNGGFCETLWSNLPSLRERFGDERALAACEASSESVRAIFSATARPGAWIWSFTCRRQNCPPSETPAPPTIRSRVCGFGGSRPNCRRVMS